MLFFFTYFKRSIKNALINEIKLNSTLKKEVLNNAFSYDIKVNDSDITYLDLIPNKEDRISNELIVLLIKFKNSMPYEMSWVFELFYNGYNESEIGLLLNKDESTIKKYLGKIKSHALTYKYLFLDFKSFLDTVIM